MNSRSRVLGLGVVVAAATLVAEVGWAAVVQPGGPATVVPMAASTPAPAPAAGSGEADGASPVNEPAAASPAGTNGPGLPGAAVGPNGALVIVVPAHLSKLTLAKAVRFAGVTVTLQHGSKDEIVTLIGVESPVGSDPSLKPAEAALHNMLAGETVWVMDLESGRHSEQGKRAVYLFRAPDGLLVNYELVRQGYAREQAAFAYQYQNAMRAGEGVARSARKGLWAEAADAASQPGKDGGKEGGKEGVKNKDGKPGSAGDGTARVSPEAKPDGKGEVKAEIKPEVKAEPKPIDLFATRSGTRYHRTGCKFLTNTKDPITLDDAAKRGLKPCSECKPPGIEGGGAATPGGGSGGGSAAGPGGGVNPSSGGGK